MTSREQQILELIRDDPMLAQHVIAERLGISRSAVAGHIMHLSNKGLIRGRGYVLSTAPFVVAIGGANIDIHGKSVASLRPKDSNPGDVGISAGGVARNVAENLVRLGTDCRLIAVTGDDQLGRMLRRLSRDAGVDMQYVHTIDTAPTSTYLSVLDHSGDLQVAVADMRITECLNANLLHRHKAMLQQSAAILLDANLTGEALTWLAATLSNKPLFADAVSAAKAPRLIPILSSIHTLKASVLEAESLTGLNAKTDKQLQKAAEKLHQEGVERLFITRGSKGLFYSTANEHGTMAPPKRNTEISNVGGAGDAFVAGLIYGWLSNLSLKETIRTALATADIALSHHHTNNPALSIAAVNRAMENFDASSTA